MAAPWRAWSLVIGMAIAVLSSPTALSLAGPINTDVALTPRQGGSIFRLQYIYSELDGPGDAKRANTSTVRGTYVYGLKKDLALFFTVPYVNRQGDRVDRQLGRLEEAHDGIADLTFFAKYRFWQKDAGPAETMRWAAIGGLNIRSGDSDFSSDSYDPIVGTVFSWRKQRSRFDADLFYQFNTGRNDFRHDTLRYDAAYSHRLWPVVYDSDDAWELGGVAELNGRYVADGSHELFVSPGIQFVTEDWVLETSFQWPVIQDLEGAEADYRIIISLRFQW